MEFTLAQGAVHFLMARGSLFIHPIWKEIGSLAAGQALRQQADALCPGLGYSRWLIEFSLSFPSDFDWGTCQDPIS